MSDNQPQVGTCDRSKHPLPHAKTPSCWSWIALPQPTPAEPRTMRLPKNAAHPNFNEFHKEDDWCARAGCTVVCDSWPPAGKMETPAEPRIDTVPDEFQQDWADYDRRGIAGGWEKVAFASGWGRGFKRGEARAGSSLSPDLQNLAQVARAKRTAWHEDFGVPISQTYAEFLEAIGLLIEACERASPPSSPGAAQTCPNCGGSLLGTSHGLYCPNEHCKWGWEVEMDGSPLKPPIPHRAE